MLDDKKTFTALFNQLKGRVRNSPIKLSWLAEQKSDIRRLAFLVGDIARRIEKVQATKPERHDVVPTGYITARRDYDSNYKDVVDLVVRSETQRNAKDFVEKIRSIAAEKDKDFDCLFNKIIDEIEAKRKPGDSFDPLEDDPASLIQTIFSMYCNTADDFAPDDSYDKAIGAWLFFDETIGLDHASIYKRWKSVPELLIPKHALSVNSRPIEELYNEAARAFVFGNKIAAIAMCRALLEHILRKHYGIDAEGLDKMITVAEGRFERFRKFKLQSKRKLANRVMHDYELRLSPEDKSVIDFLATIREMVKDIPKSA